MERNLREELDKAKLTNLECIGSNSILSEADAKWLERLAENLYEEGSYTKAIYLQHLVENAEKKNG